jgi:hypothetical protein
LNAVKPSRNGLSEAELEEYDREYGVAQARFKEQLQAMQWRLVLSTAKELGVNIPERLFKGRKGFPGTDDVEDDDEDETEGIENFDLDDFVSDNTYSVGPWQTPKFSTIYNTIQAGAASTSKKRKRPPGDKNPNEDADKEKKSGGHLNSGAASQKSHKRQSLPPHAGSGSRSHPNSGNKGGSANSHPHHHPNGDGVNAGEKDGVANAADVNGDSGADSNNPNSNGSKRLPSMSFLLSPSPVPSAMQQLPSLASATSSGSNSVAGDEGAKILSGFANHGHGGAALSDHLLQKLPSVGGGGGTREIGFDYLGRFLNTAQLQQHLSQQQQQQLQQHLQQQLQLQQQQQQAGIGEHQTNIGDMSMGAESEAHASTGGLPADGGRSMLQTLHSLHAQARAQELEGLKTQAQQPSHEEDGITRARAEPSSGEAGDGGTFVTAVAAAAAGGNDMGDDSSASSSRAESQEKEKEKTQGTPGKRTVTKWTETEKEAFLAGFKAHGKTWAALARLVPTKTSSQIKNYYQNYKVYFCSCSLLSLSLSLSLFLSPLPSLFPLLSRVTNPQSSHPPSPLTFTIATFAFATVTGQVETLGGTCKARAGPRDGGGGSGISARGGHHHHHPDHGCSCLFGGGGST